MEKLIEKVELAILCALYAYVSRCTAAAWRPDEGERKAKEAVEYMRKRATK